MGEDVAQVRHDLEMEISGLRDSIRSLERYHADLTRSVAEHARNTERFMTQFADFVEQQHMPLAESFNEHGHAVNVDLSTRKTVCSKPIKADG